MKQELLYSTKLRWLDDRHLSINCYVVFACTTSKIFTWQANKIVRWQVWQWLHLVDETCSRLLTATYNKLMR